MIVTSTLLSKIDSNKIIPIIKQQGSRLVPTFLKTKLFIDFSRNDGFEFSYDELIRTFHNSPIFVKPPVGNNPFTPVAAIAPEKSGDALLELMKIVVISFESGEDYLNYRELLATMGISRILLDVLIAQAKEEKYISQDTDKDVRLLDKGKFYALQHKL